ncbi:hypothetical protein [Helicobacter cinaedi]|nr:hypothetical protein [Helicobacter cinaedi]
MNNGDFAKAGCGCNATYFDVLLVEVMSHREKIGSYQSYGHMRL